MVMLSAVTLPSVGVVLLCLGLLGLQWFRLKIADYSVSNQCCHTEWIFDNKGTGLNNLLPFQFSAGVLKTWQMFQSAC